MNRAVKRNSENQRKRENEMGVSDGATYGNAKKPGKRGSKNNKRRLEAFGKAKKGGSADWGGCDERILQSVVQQITALGGAVTFGLSRDEGAHMLTLLLDNEKETLWFNGDADLSEELALVAAKLEAMS